MTAKIRRKTLVFYRILRYNLDEDAKSVRLDVYVEDENNTVYDIEIQAINTKELPKRSRFYHGMIDLNLINKGAHYSELRKCYVIFICLFDPFKTGRHIYTLNIAARKTPASHWVMNPQRFSSMQRVN